MPFGAIDPPTQFNVPFLRYMQRYGLSEETLATIPVIQREWAAKNPRAYARDPLTVDEVLDSRMIAYPFRKLMCCLVTDGGGALILTSAERAPDRPSRPVYLLGTGEGVGDTAYRPDRRSHQRQGLSYRGREGIWRGGD